eukprot:4995121-Amphidinium_carterae.1
MASKGLSNKSAPDNRKILVLDAPIQLVHLETSLLAFEHNAPEEESDEAALLPHSAMVCATSGSESHMPSGSYTSMPPNGCAHPRTSMLRC